MSSLIITLTDRASSVQVTPVIEDITRKCTNVKFGSSLGTGFNVCKLDISLPYSKAREWYERYLFFGINVYEAGDPVWEGRIEAIRITNDGVSLACAGYWSSLTDQRLYSFWSDNQMDKWIIPTVGGGAISDEIGLSGLVNEKGWIYKDRAFWGFGLKRGQSYAIGDRIAIYYRLPRTDHLTKSGIFQPNTIHSIQYQWDRNGIGSPTPFTHRVWTALHAKDTSWTEKDATSPTGTPAIKTVNIGANSDQIQAVAFGIEFINTITSYPVDDGSTRMIFTDVTIWAERDAARSLVNENTPKKMISGYLNGNSNINLDAKAKQLSDDLLNVNIGEAEIIPAVYEDETILDILNSSLGPGSGILYNLVDNPSLEVDYYGWNDHLGTPVTRSTGEVTGGKGLYAAKDINITAEGQGITIVNRDYTSFSVTEGRFCTVSIYACQTNYPADVNFFLRLHWYTSGGSDLGTNGATVTVPYGTILKRVKAIGLKVPATAAHVQIELVTASTPPGTLVLYADGAMLQEYRDNDKKLLEPYIDGDQVEGLWSGDAHKSTSLRLQPNDYGVWGYRRLKVNPRDSQNIKWVIPLTSIEDNGLSLERTLEDFWVAVWGKFNESFTGLDSYTDVIENTLGKELIWDERDRAFDFGAVLTELAEAAGRVALADFSTPRQRADIELKGTIVNILGVREPLWRVRAGDLMVVPDLIPFHMYGSRGLYGDDPYNKLDHSTIFIIRETEYDAKNNTLNITPDLPPQTLESVLANAASLSSYKPGTLIKRQRR